MERHIEHRIQAGTLMVAYVLTYLFAIVVLFLDIFVWRPW